MARTARTFSRLFLSAILVILGIGMLVLPGPGLLTIALGLGIAGRTLRWAWVLRMERRIRQQLRRTRRAIEGLHPSLG